MNNPKKFGEIFDWGHQKTEKTQLGEWIPPGIGKFFSIGPQKNMEKITRKVRGIFPLGPQKNQWKKTRLAVQLLPFFIPLRIKSPFIGGPEPRGKGGGRWFFWKREDCFAAFRDEKSLALANMWCTWIEVANFFLQICWYDFSPKCESYQIFSPKPIWKWPTPA